MNSNANRDTLIPWENLLPKDWRCTRIDNVADVFFSNVDKHTIDNEEPVRLCNYTDVYKNDRITGNIDFMEASAELHEIKKFQIQRGDVLSTKDSETPDDIAISALVDDDLPKVLCGYHLALMRPRSRKLYGPYLAWVHASKQYRAQYEAKAVGVTRFGLSQYAFRAARLPFPPLIEQKRIAAYLDASCTAIDAAVAAKRRQIEMLEQLLKVMVKNAVTHGLDTSVQLVDSGEPTLGMIPSHWRKTKLRYEISVHSGDFVSDKFEEDGIYPVIGGNAEMGRTSKYNVDGDVVVIGRVGALCGNAHYVKGRAWISDNALIVKSNNNKLYLCNLIRVLDFNSTAKKTAQPLVTSTQIKNTYVGMPRIAEQARIADFIEAKEQIAFDICKNLKEQIETLLAYRKSLIHECVTGQRRVTEKDIKRAEQWQNLNTEKQRK